MLKNSKPIIGISLDSQAPGGYADFPWYALRADYSNAASAHGAVPLLLPYHSEHSADYINLIDGLIITGGDFDIDPSYYGEKITSERVITNSSRTQFEITLTELALKTGTPILGICGGEQLLNIILGGTLIQHIPDTVPNCLIHEQPKPKNLPWHEVNIMAGSLLHKITGQLQIKVNSTHHQAIKAPAPGVMVSGTAPDGVIEAIEYPAHPFCLGVEWHPEYQLSDADKLIFQEFVRACNDHRKNR